MSGYIGLSPTTLKNLSGTTQVVHNDTADYVLANDALTLNPNILIGGALTAQRNVIVPVTVSTYIIQNATTGGFAIVVKTPGGTGVTIPPGATSLVRPNGTNVIGVYHPGDPGSPFAASDITANGVVKATGNVNLKTTVALADAAATLTAAQLVNSGIFTITPTVARILTTDTAANIVAALPRYQVGTWFDFTIVNTAAFDVTLAAGTGITLVGKMIAHNASGTFKARIDSATAVTIFSTDVASVAGSATQAFSASTFTGAGTGLTGIAAGLSIGGNAATASSATDPAAARLAGSATQAFSASTFTGALNGNATTASSATDPAAARLAGSATQAFSASTLTAANVPVIDGTAPVYACRAWVNFNGVPATVAIRASGNVSSITDNGVGEYVVNFTTAMVDANYCATFSAKRQNQTSNVSGTVGETFTTAVRSASAIGITTADGINGFVDLEFVSVAIFR